MDFSGLFSMFGAYQRWCRTTSTRAQYYENMLEMCGLLDDPECPKAGRHRERERAEIKKSEEVVTRTITSIESFTNPFNVADKDHLYSLASGAPVPPEQSSTYSKLNRLVRRNVSRSGSRVGHQRHFSSSQLSDRG